MNALAAAFLREMEGIVAISGALRAETQEFSLRGPRAGLCAAVTLSVALATVVALAMHLDDPWWAAISAFMCSQATRPAAFSKGVLRMVGTIIGALFALALGSWLAYDPVACSLALFLATFIGMLGFQVSAHAYAWLLGAITFDFVVLTALTAPQTAFHFAAYRIIEIAVGVAAAMLLAFLLAPEDSGPPAAPAPGWRSLLDAPDALNANNAVLHAVRTGVTVMLVPPVWAWFELPSLAQMAITIAAVMAVPPASSGAADPGRVMVTRALHRLLGCLLGGAVALAVLAAPLTLFIPWLFVLSAGVWAGCHLQASARGIGYVGTQATVVFIMALVQGAGPPLSIWPGVDRLGGVVLGILLLLAVSLAMMAFSPSPRAAPLSID